MNTKTTTAVNATILPLTTLAAGVTKTARRGKAIRLYRQDKVLVGCEEAITSLLQSGASVRVYEKNRIYTPRLDGGLVWEHRETSKERATVVVEVVL